ncbi:MAG: M48 family metalloprotease [Myxococcota bacterium]
MSQPHVEVAVQPVPLRTELLERYAALRRAALPALVMEAVLLATLLGVLDWRMLPQHWVHVVVVVGIAVGDTVVAVIQFLTQNKQRVDRLPPDVKLGNFTRAQLQELVTDACRRFGVSPRRIPVYITREKEMNAHAMHVGPSFLVQALRAVSINRANLHVLTPAELSYILGHELAHLLHYPAVWLDAHALHMASRAAACLVAWQWAFPRFGDFWGLSAALAAAAVHRFFTQRTSPAQSQMIELLCDDSGARLAGVNAAISCELKTGMMGELHHQLLFRALQLQKQGMDISYQDLYRIYLDVVPFGSFALEEVDARIQERARKSAQPSRELTLRGLLEFAGLSGDSRDAREQVREQLRVYEGLSRIPRISWPRNVHGQPTDTDLMALAQALEREPQALLFETPGELDALSSHPSHRRRVLYLWNNRGHITAKAFPPASNGPGRAAAA